MAEKSKTWIIIIVIIIILIFLSIFGLVSIGEPEQQGNVALIPVEGQIMVDSTSIFGQAVASSEKITELIKKADENSDIEAILFEINSPGGSAVASDEIAEAIKNSNKMTVCLIREVGASGGYWIASACDLIVANRMSITGSIGVIGSYLEFSDFLTRYNVSYQRLVSGEYKDMGSPLKELTRKEQTLLQAKFDKIHEFFIEAIAENRGLPIEDVRSLADGSFFLGVEAKELGLVDFLGNQETAISLIEEELNISVELVDYEEKKSLLELLSGVMNKNSFFVGKGIAQAMLEKSEEIGQVKVLV